MGCSGLDGQLGFLAEPSYGDGGTPTRFLYFEDESISHKIERMESPSLGRGSNTALHADDWESGVVQADGSINYMVRNKGFGLIFKHMMGSNSITTPGGATLTRDHTCSVATMTGLSLAVQVGRPDSAGVVQPFNYKGAKITEWEITNSVSEFLQLALTLDIRDTETTTVIATESYATTPKLFSFTGGVITIGGTTQTIKNCSVKGNSGLDTDDFNIGSTLKAEPCQTANWEFSGGLDGNFSGMTDYDRFIAGTTSAAVVLTWTGALIEAGHSYTVTITLPSVRWDDVTVNVGGPDRVQHDLPFKALGSAQTIIYRTTDTAD